MKKQLLLLSLLAGININAALADVVARISLQQGLQQDNVDIRLLEQAAPLSVANFLRYANGTTVNGGSYTNSIFHRSIDTFILQNGGLTFDPLVNDGSFSYDAVLDEYPGGLQQIEADNPVDNEFKLSNVRGTLAMAKLPGNPDSATSQWFFNLANNAANLDNQNGGFSVFARVIDDGMDVVDTIASIPVFDKLSIHSALQTLPLLDYTNLDPIVLDNLVRINSITPMFSISKDLEFGLLLTGDSMQSIVTIENITSDDVVIGNIASTNALALPFSIPADDDYCSNTTLEAMGNCDITVNYSPQQEAINQDGFNIEFITPLVSLEYTVNGSAADVLSPDILNSHAELAFGVTQLFDSEIDPNGNFIVLVITNVGNIELNITSVTADFDSALDIEFIDNCTAKSPLPPNDACAIPVFFKPENIGELSGTLTIVSDDPDENPLVLPITGVAETDVDGILGSIEDAAPNNGDGNLDNIPDSAQNNVSSFLSLNNEYISLVTGSTNMLMGINVLSIEELDPLPLPLAEDLNFSYGILDFDVDIQFPSGTAEVALILPKDVTVESYYMFGPTNEDSNPHWYEFTFDEETGTGAIIFNDVTLSSAIDGSSIKRTIVRLFFKDGERGDADLLANGTIIDPGGPVIKNNSSSSGGSLNSYLIFVLFLLPILRIQFNRTFNIMK